jgi:hypothetical protein
MSSTQDTFKRPGGDITTLLDLTNRDMQDNKYFPLGANTSWFARNSDRRFTPFVPLMQDFQYRGPAAFGLPGSSHYGGAFNNSGIPDRVGSTSGADLNNVSRV